MQKFTHKKTDRLLRNTFDTDTVYFQYSVSLSESGQLRSTAYEKEVFNKVNQRRWKKLCKLTEGAHELSAIFNQRVQQRLTFQNGANVLKWSIQFTWKAKKISSSSRTTQ